MRVLVIGSGGREHALAWKLSQSPSLSDLHAAPGNPGIAALGACHPVNERDREGLLALARELGTELAVVGPEAPLAAGVADALRQNGIAVFGPSAAAARIESSKTFAKELMRSAGIPTARTLPVARPPCVLKADGLAAGKGVFVCRDAAELDKGLRAVARFPGPVVIEELLEGEEVSVFALTDGVTAVALPAAQDWKRLEDGDRGPNTGGMGSYAPAAALDTVDVEAIVDTVHRAALAELAARGTPFSGLLYAGLMLTADGPRVLEFNCRFGDPETQSILPLLDADLAQVLAAAAGGDLTSATELTPSGEACVTVVLAAAAYPTGRAAAEPIAGLEEAEAAGALVFHAGTALRDGRLVAHGGRVLNVTAVGATVAEARDSAYGAVGRIDFSGMRYRRDVAAAASEVHVRG